MDSFVERNQRLVSKRQLFFITLGMIFFVLFNGVCTQHQSMISTLFFVLALPLTFYIAMYPIANINFKSIYSVLDPRIWLPISYVIYFVVLPCISIFFDSKYSTYNDEIPQVMLSTVLGIISLQLGLHLFKSRLKSIEKEIPLDKYATALLLLFTLIIHGYYWYWRIDNGYFFTHSAGYSPAANIETGIRDLLGGSVICVPLVILAVAYRNEHWKNIIALHLFVVYSSVIVILNILSGQIRSLFFFSLMILALSVYMSQSNQLIWRRIRIVIPFLFVGTVIFVYTLRYSASIIGEAENPVKYVLLNLPDIVQVGRETAEETDGVKSLVLYRIFMTQEFFLNTVRALNDENSSYGYGSYTMRNLPIVIPRLLWPEKGRIDDTEDIIQEDVLHANPIDLSLTPLTQFYAEGSIFGVLISFFLVGLITDFVHKVCFSIKNRIGGLVCWVVILGSIIQFENNIPIELLLGIRNGLLFVALAYIASALTWVQR